MKKGLPSFSYLRAFLYNLRLICARWAHINLNICFYSHSMVDGGFEEMS